ncbi:hypothetical protein E1287_36760 [Actinomadura sp. KC06]|nr:hypothetical protein E1287_36760 [Actinomadura sp. KC06]
MRRRTRRKGTARSVPGTGSPNAPAAPTGPPPNAWKRSGTGWPPPPRPPPGSPSPQASPSPPPRATPPPSPRPASWSRCRGRPR